MKIKSSSNILEMNTIATFVRNGVRIIKFNRPNKKNAVGISEFDQIRKIITDDINNNTTKVSVLTGANNYFTSGLDMAAAYKEIETKDNLYADKMATSLQKLVEQIIDYPKLLIAVVNGPAFGIGVTILPLCDYVYASDCATFQCPFVKLGINAEGCSSLTFPAIMGTARTFELIFAGKKLDVDMAKQYGLVGQIYKDGEIDNIYKDIENLATLPYHIVKKNKKLINDNFRQELLECNKRECNMLKVTLKSQEFLSTVNTFLTRKSKS